MRGYFSSEASDQNTATVSQSTVALHAQVKDDAGNTLAFDAPALRITDSYHFSGAGTIGGTAVTIDGHVDPPDPDPTAGSAQAPGRGALRKVVSNARLECTYMTAAPQRHCGRVVGSLQGGS